MQKKPTIIGIYQTGLVLFMKITIQVGFIMNYLVGCTPLKLHQQAVGSGTEGFDWIWTSDQTYPYFYHNDSSSWLFF